MDFVCCLSFFWVTWTKTHWWSHLHPTGDCTRFVLWRLHTGDLNRATSSAGEMLTHTNRPYEISGGTKSCNRDAHTQNSLIIITKTMATEESTHTIVTQAVCQTHMMQDDKGSPFSIHSLPICTPISVCLRSVVCTKYAMSGKTLPSKTKNLSLNQEITDGCSFEIHRATRRNESATKQFGDHLTFDHFNPEKNKFEQIDKWISPPYFWIKLIRHT